VNPRPATRILAGLRHDQVTGLDSRRELSTAASVS
jgi:hypothetical protein